MPLSAPEGRARLAPLAWSVSPRARSRLFSFKQPLRLWGEQRGHLPAPLCLLPKVLETHSLLPSGGCVRRRGLSPAYPPSGHSRPPPQPFPGNSPWCLGTCPLCTQKTGGPGVSSFSGHCVAMPGLRGTRGTPPPVSPVMGLSMVDSSPVGGQACETPELGVAPGAHLPHPLSWTASSTASSPSSRTLVTPGLRRTEWPMLTWPAGSWLWPTPSCCSGTGAPASLSRSRPGRPSGASSCAPGLVQERGLRGQAAMHGAGQ